MSDRCASSGGGSGPRQLLARWLEIHHGEPAKHREWNYSDSALVELAVDLDAFPSILCLLAV